MSFKLLGLSEYEIKVFETLLKKGKLNAKEISQYSLVPITAVYPTIKSLIQRKLAQQITGKINLFYAIDPTKSIKGIIQKQKEDLVRIEKEIVAYAQKLPEEKKENKIKKEIVSMSYGREISQSIYFDACKKVKEKYYVLGWKLKKIADKYTFLRELKKLVKKGVDVRIILTGDKDKNKQLITDYKEAGILIKYIPIKSDFSIFVFDGKECKITLKNKKLDQRYNLQIYDEALANALQDYFLEKWKTAQEI